MSLRHATLDGVPFDLRGEAPFLAADLGALRGRRFDLPCLDPWVEQAGDVAHAYVESAREGWVSHPEYMDFLAFESPVFSLKRAEADLCLHHWADALDVARVLDVGCGIGRFGIRFLEQGCTVYGVDPDLESLRRFAWHAAGRKGRLDLFWASVHRLPEVEVDLAIAAEVLCYVPEHESALSAIASRVVPGGTVLVSVEAPYGWALSQDAPPDTLECALTGEPVVEAPGDRWVRTFDRPSLESWFAGAGLQVRSIRPSHWIPDGPLEGTAPSDLSLEQLISLEERCRRHPVWGPLHRLWLVTATRS